jgi:hypothetical protein
VATMDIGSAYLNAEMKSPPMFMRLDKIPTAVTHRWFNFKFPTVR